MKNVKKDLKKDRKKYEKHKKLTNRLAFYYLK